MSQGNSRKRQEELRVRFLPFDDTVQVSAGTTILEAARMAGLPLKTTCGGKGTCGNCVVRVLRGTHHSKSSAALSDELSRQGYALACQTEVHDHLVVQLPQFEELRIRSVLDRRYFEDNRNKLSGIYEVSPAVRIMSFHIPSSTVQDNYSDLKKLERHFQKEFPGETLHCQYSVLKKLARVVREKQGEISAVLFKQDHNWTLLDVEPAAYKKNIYGLACDLGTTTVSLYLVDMASGKIRSTASSYNHQLKCGEDVISRINYAQKPGHLQELKDLIILTVNNLIQSAVKSAGIKTTDIYYASMTGNTTMIHLFLNLEPRYIREEPYVPTFNQVPLLLARDIGLDMNYEGRVLCGPAVGSYVGSDITAGLLVTPLLRDSEKISLFIDVGTNGELVVGNKDWLMSCACSAGPAFEGGGIRCGMPATEGAIEKVNISESGQLEYKVFNGGKPKGLCGSGLIDLLAELFMHGYVDRSGQFNREKAKDRLVEAKNGIGFLIEKAEHTYWGKDLIITQNDITNLIRTKGAVFSGCSFLLRNVGLPLSQIDAVYIAGSFGQRLNVENAIRIGLLPDLEKKKYHYIGNSSLLGAYLILLSDKNRELVNQISDKMTYIELNTEPSYMNEFTGTLFLPHTQMDLFPSVTKAIRSRTGMI
ncbi:MAG: ASKHA domain-containing protein [Candidatus Aminicenantes bacterium]